MHTNCCVITQSDKQLIRIIDNCLPVHMYSIQLILSLMNFGFLIYFCQCRFFVNHVTAFHITAVLIVDQIWMKYKTYGMMATETTFHSNHNFVKRAHWNTTYNMKPWLTPKSNVYIVWCCQNTIHENKFEWGVSRSFVVLEYVLWIFVICSGAVYFSLRYMVTCLSFNMLNNIVCSYKTSIAHRRSLTRYYSDSIFLLFHFATQIITMQISGKIRVSLFWSLAKTLISQKELLKL